MVKQPLILHISKFANVVYFNIFFASTQFTGICQQSFYKLRSSAIHLIRLVLNNGFALVDKGGYHPKLQQEASYRAVEQPLVSRGLLFHLCL